MDKDKNSKQENRCWLCLNRMPIPWELQRFIGLAFWEYLAVVSAKVGSIQDNRLGGQYSYRASKAALISDYEIHLKGVCAQFDDVLSFGANVIACVNSDCICKLEFDFEVA